MKIEGKKTRLLVPKSSVIAVVSWLTMEVSVEAKRAKQRGYGWVRTGGLHAILLMVIILGV